MCIRDRYRSKNLINLSFPFTHSLVYYLYTFFFLIIHTLIPIFRKGISQNMIDKSGVGDGQIPYVNEYELKARMAALKEQYKEPAKTNPVMLNTTYHYYSYYYYYYLVLTLTNSSFTDLDLQMILVIYLSLIHI